MMTDVHVADQNDAWEASLKIIDVDTHITEPPDLWSSRAPRGYEHRLPHVVNIDGTDRWVAEGAVFGPAGGFCVIKPDGEKGQATRIFDDIGYHDIHRAAYDMSVRLPVMDAVGIYAQIVYPNFAGFGGQTFMNVLDPEVRRLCSTIYNDAMAEIQEQSGGRLLPMGLVPWWSVKDAAAEVHRVAALGLRGVVTCSDPHYRGQPDLGDPAWDPFWEACSEHSLPVNFHIGANSNENAWWGQYPWPTLNDDAKLALGTVMMTLANGSVIGNLIYSGVLERHPDLRIVSVESGIGWLPYLLEALDWQYREAGSASFELRMMPSDYFKRQVYGSFWFEDTGLEQFIQAVGPDNAMFETDFPHPTCFYPSSRLQALKKVERLPVEVRQKVLQDNAARLYRIEL
jgi:predicted TIM-barrel fold metal-dependent hydrolase